MTVDGPAADRFAGAVWERTLARLRARVDEDLVDVWLEPLQPEVLSDRTLILRAPRQIRGWVAERFGRALDAALQEELGAGAGVEVIGPDTDIRTGPMLVPSAHEQIRVPAQWLLHFPVERDRRAAENWYGDIRRFEHVGASVAVDHVSRPSHLRAMIATAAHLQDGAPPGGRLLVDPWEFLRAGGIAPGGRDVAELLRVLGDWNVCQVFQVTLHVPSKAKGTWGPRHETAIIHRPPARTQVLTADGELIDPADARERRLPAAQIAALQIDVAEEFVDAVADERGCRLLARDTLRRAGRALVTYARYQALTPTKTTGRPVITRYSARPWLQQLGLHGRTSPSPADASPPDGSARASRRRAQHLRAAEAFVVEDLWWLAEIDRGYAWVRQGDAGNGYAVIRVGQGIDDAGRRVYGATDAASQARQPPRREWRNELRRRGLHATERRVFLGSRGRRRNLRTPHVVARLLDATPRRRKRRHGQLRPLKILRGEDEPPATAQ